MKKQITLILATTFLLTSCEFTKQDGGTLIGGATGALIGSTIGGGAGKGVAIAGGAILGALIGNKIGAALDEVDKQKLNDTTQKALESGRSGQSTEWNNPDSGHSGTVTPRKAYKSKDGDYCREYSQTVNIGGETKKAYGTACRRPDGSWEMVSSR